MICQKNSTWKGDTSDCLDYRFEVMLENQEFDEALDLSKVLNLDSWSVGLH